MARVIDGDALYQEFEAIGWYDNADRDLAEDILLRMPALTSLASGDLYAKAEAKYKVSTGVERKCWREVLDMICDDITITPPNEPLTLEQLREMVGEPVYDYLGQEWYVIAEYYDHELCMKDGTCFFDDDELDRVNERFYRRPPY